ncbi:MAG: acetylserotonin O-methyltransferase [Candidatus Aminicenantes bacterium]|nr:acetylserotonin O-methyltransferase [Candidatus Aminicenantes bacterium]
MIRDKMKKLPEVNMSFNKLYRMLAGLIKSKLISTGIELKIFNQLSEPKSAEAVARTIGTHPGNTKLFLDALAAIDLVMKKNSLYHNAPITQAFLVEGSPTFLGPMLTLTCQMGYVAMENLPGLVREGPHQLSPEADMDTEETWAQFGAAMANYQRAGLAQQAVQIVSELPEFPLFKKMLDLGGGPGVVGIAIVAAHPSMKGVIFDKPAVVKVAENFIREYEMEDRIEVLGGDYNHEPIGDGYDLIWASAALYSARNNIDSLMKKIYDVLNPGGVFVAFHEGLTNERTKPDIHVLFSFSMALMGQDACFDQGFIADSMLSVGFKSVRSRTLDTSIGPMDLDIGRKA